MNRWPALLLFVFALLPCMSSAQEDGEDIEAKLREPVPEASDAASEKIIAKHLEVLGGLERIKAITNTVSKGLKKEAKEDYNITYYRAAPDKLRVETGQIKSGRPHTDIQGTNGEAFWTFIPEEKNAFPKEMSKKDAASFALEADFYGPLVDSKDKGYIFRYEGEAKSRGRKHYLVHMFFPTGYSVYFYFDTKTLMVTRVGKEAIVGNSIVETDIFYTKYDRVNGVWMPTQMEFALEGQVYGSLTLDSIKANQPLEADLFDMPKVKEVWLKKK